MGRRRHLHLRGFDGTEHGHFHRHAHCHWDTAEVRDVRSVVVAATAVVFIVAAAVVFIVVAAVVFIVVAAVVFIVVAVVVYIVVAAVLLPLLLLLLLLLKVLLPFHDVVQWMDINCLLLNRMKYGPAPQIVTVGTDVVLLCTVESFPQATHIWFKVFRTLAENISHSHNYSHNINSQNGSRVDYNNLRYQLDESTGTLTLMNAQSEDSAKYVCQVSSASL